MRPVIFWTLIINIKSFVTFITPPDRIRRRLSLAADPETAHAEVEMVGVCRVIVRPERVAEVKAALAKQRAQRLAAWSALLPAFQHAYLLAVGETKRADIQRVRRRVFA